MRVCLLNPRRQGSILLLLQKLQNVQVTLQAEQKACEALKKKHAAANLEKRRCYSLLKAFQVSKFMNYFLFQLL